MEASVPDPMKVLKFFPCSSSDFTQGCERSMVRDEGHMKHTCKLRGCFGGIFGDRRVSITLTFSFRHGDL